MNNVLIFASPGNFQLIRGVDVEAECTSKLKNVDDLEVLMNLTKSSVCHLFKATNSFVSLTIKVAIPL